MVTVLMATYQGKKYLEQQLDSILAQTVPVRIFVSDDGSDDGTREMLFKYQGWYPEQVFLMHRPVGPEAGRNIPPAACNFFWLLGCAAREGRSDYIMLSDQDDVWFNCKVKCMLARMKELEEELGTEHPILLHSDMEVTDERLDQIHPSFFSYQHCDPERASFAEVLVENPVTGGALMMNRALLELVTGMKKGRAEAETLEKRWQKLLPCACYMHDWWIALVASCFGTIDCIQEPLYQYRQHSANTLGAKKTGSLEDMTERLGRRQQVRENYSRMFQQAVAFGRRYGRYMSPEQKDILRAFLALPVQSPAIRFKNIRDHHLYKSTLTQIFGMCLLMPKVKPTAGERRHGCWNRKSSAVEKQTVKNRRRRRA